MATSRVLLASCGIVGIAVVAAGWLAGPAPRTASAPSAQVIAGSLDDLLMDLELIPLDGRAPKPFSLSTLDGRQLTLADLAGRPALLYFWATW